MGYTRLHVAHFSAVPFLTSVTGVLQLGHARISSSSGSTGMLGLYDTLRFLWKNWRNEDRSPRRGARDDDLARGSAGARTAAAASGRRFGQARRGIQPVHAGTSPRGEGRRRRRGGGVQAGDGARPFGLRHSRRARGAVSAPEQDSGSDERG